MTYFHWFSLIFAVFDLSRPLEVRLGLYFRVRHAHGCPWAGEGVEMRFPKFPGPLCSVSFPILVENGLFSLIFTDFAVLTSLGP